MVLFKELESAGAGNYLSPIWIPSVKGIVRGKRAVRLTGSFLSQYHIFEYLCMNDHLVIHIHHVIVRQYKSSTESVSFEHLRICHRKGRTALKFLGPTHLPSAATLPDLASPHSTFWLKILYPQSEFPQSKGKRAVRIYYYLPIFTMTSIVRVLWPNIVHFR
jgi:hypothetical protein